MPYILITFGVFSLASVQIKDVIEKTLHFKDSLPLQQTQKSFDDSEKSYRDTLAGYGVKLNSSFSYTKSQSFQNDTTNQSDSDRLSLVASKISLLPLGTVLNLSSELYQTNMFQSESERTAALSVGLSYAIPITAPQFLQNNLTLKLAAQNYLLASTLFRDNKLGLILTNIQKYLTFLQSMNAYTTQKKTMQNAEKMLEIAKYKFELGQASKLDVYDLQTQRVNSQVALLSSKKSIEASIRDLHETLGLSVTVDENFSLPYFNTRSFRLRPFTEYYQIFTEKSYYMANYAIQSENIEESFLISSESDAPNLNLSGTYTKPINALSPQSDAWNVQAMFSKDFSIFNEQKTLANGGIIRQYEENTRQLREQLKDKIRSLKDAYDSIQLVMDNILLSNEQLQLASDALDIAKMRHRSGKISSLDLNKYVDANNTALFNDFSQKISFFMSLLNFYQDIGYLQTYLDQEGYYEFFK